MPTNRRSRKVPNRAQITEAQWAWLLDDRDKANKLDAWEQFELGSPHNDYENLRRLWGQYRDTVLEVWIAERPGTRPSTWWLIDAPRIPAGKWPGSYYDGKLPQPRQQLRGSGSPAWESVAVTPHFLLGIPESWGDLNADDPPVFESQAAYLDRLGLLAPGEKRRLRGADFEPETLLCLSDFEFPTYENILKRRRKETTNAKD